MDRIAEGQDRSGGPDACWPWLGSKTEAGYGRLSIGGREIYVHRLVYEATHGPLAPDIQVRHQCNNPPCGNPKHLLEGTNLDNVADRLRSGRQPMGSGHVCAVLDEEGVREARRLAASGVSNAELARRFGVAHQTIWNAVHGKSWKHVAAEPLP